MKIRGSLKVETFRFDKLSPIWIYGHGFLGIPLYNRLSQAGYKIEGFIDRNASKLQKRFPYKIISPENIEDTKLNDIIILTFQNIQEHEKTAKKLSAKNRKCLIYLYRNSNYYPRTFELFNSLVYGNFEGEFDFPKTIAKKDEVITFYKEYDEFVVTEIPMPLAFSALLESPIEGDGQKNRAWRYPISALYEYNAFFDLMFDGECDQSYLERYSFRLRGMGRTKEEFLNNRAELCRVMLSEFQRGGLLFFQNAPAHAEYELSSGKFYLTDGHHRACFLVKVFQNRIPIRIKKSEYKQWINKEMSNYLTKHLDKNNFWHSLYSPILHPDFYQICTETDWSTYLNVIALYKFFAKKDMSKTRVIDMDSNLSYYSRVFVRLGALQVVSVESRGLLRETAKLINELENCNPVILMELPPEDLKETFNILLWLNDKIPIFQETISNNKKKEIDFVNHICNKYFIIKLEFGAETEAAINFIIQNSEFENCTLINRALENGIQYGVYVFEKGRETDEN